jgi:hypothetical protein
MLKLATLSTKIDSDLKKALVSYDQLKNEEVVSLVASL